MFYAFVVLLLLVALPTEASKRNVFYQARWEEAGAWLIEQGYVLCGSPENTTFSFKRHCALLACETEFLAVPNSSAAYQCILREPLLVEACDLDVYVNASTALATCLDTAFNSSACQTLDCPSPMDSWLETVATQRFFWTQGFLDLALSDLTLSASNVESTIDAEEDLFNEGVNPIIINALWLEYQKFGPPGATTTTTTTTTTDPSATFTTGECVPLLSGLTCDNPTDSVVGAGECFALLDPISNPNKTDCERGVEFVQCGYPCCEQHPMEYLNTSGLCATVDNVIVLLESLAMGTGSTLPPTTTTTTTTTEPLYELEREVSECMVPLVELYAGDFVTAVRGPGITFSTNREDFIRRSCLAAQDGSAYNRLFSLLPLLLPTWGANFGRHFYNIFYYLRRRDFSIPLLTSFCNETYYQRLLEGGYISPEQLNASFVIDLAEEGEPFIDGNSNQSTLVYSACAMTYLRRDRAGRLALRNSGVWEPELFAQVFDTINDPVDVQPGDSLPLSVVERVNATEQANPGMLNVLRRSETVPASEGGDPLDLTLIMYGNLDFLLPLHTFKLVVGENATTADFSFPLMLADMTEGVLLTDASELEEEWIEGYNDCYQRDLEDVPQDLLSGLIVDPEDPGTIAEQGSDPLGTDLYRTAIIVHITVNLFLAVIMFVLVVLLYLLHLNPSALNINK